MVPQILLLLSYNTQLLQGVIRRPAHYGVQAPFPNLEMGPLLRPPKHLSLVPSATRSPPCVLLLLHQMLRQLANSTHLMQHPISHMSPRTAVPRTNIRYRQWMPVHLPACHTLHPTG